MTSFIKAAAERYPPGFRSETTTTGRELAAQQAAGPPRWKLAALNWFGILPAVPAMLALDGTAFSRSPPLSRSRAQAGPHRRRPWRDLPPELRRIAGTELVSDWHPAQMRSPHPSVTVRQHRSAALNLHLSQSSQRKGVRCAPAEKCTLQAARLQ
jgi:hypothetical protein